MEWGLLVDPKGWLLCNGVGTTGAGPVPDMRDRFVIGSGGSTAHLSTGGSLTHNHTVTVAGHAITIEQMPSHSHETDTGSTYTFAGNDLRGVTKGPGRTLATGGGLPHTHAASSTVGNNVPPYVCLAFIVKS